MMTTAAPLPSRHHPPGRGRSGPRRAAGAVVAMLALAAGVAGCFAPAVRHTPRAYLLTATEKDGAPVATLYAVELDATLGPESRSEVLYVPAGVFAEREAAAPPAEGGTAPRRAAFLLRPGGEAGFEAMSLASHDAMIVVTEDAEGVFRELKAVSVIAAPADAAGPTEAGAGAGPDVAPLRAPELREALAARAALEGGLRRASDELAAATAAIAPLEREVAALEVRLGNLIADITATGDPAEQRRIRRLASEAQLELDAARGRRATAETSRTELATRRERLEAELAADPALDLLRAALDAARRDAVATAAAQEAAR